MHNPSEFLGFSDTNQRLLEHLSQKSVKISLIPRTNIALISKEKNRHLIVGDYTSLTSYDLGLLLSNRSVCKQLLITNGFKTANGQVFPLESKRDALYYARTLGFPLLLKQENSQIDSPSIGVQTEADFSSAFEKFYVYGQPVIVEEFIKGEVLSICYFKSGFISILQTQRLFSIESSVPKGNDRLSISNVTVIQQDTTLQYVDKIRPLTRKIHKLLGTPPWFRFTCTMENKYTDTLKILELSHSPGKHSNHLCYKGRQQHSVLDEMTIQLFPNLNP